MTVHLGLVFEGFCFYCISLLILHLSWHCFLQILLFFSFLPNFQMVPNETSFMPENDLPREVGFASISFSLFIFLVNNFTNVGFPFFFLLIGLLKGIWFCLFALFLEFQSPFTTISIPFHSSWLWDIQETDLRDLNECFQ